jgi:tetratricopeptide (TPR) repeat protein
MTLIGMQELAIEYAEYAISVESVTKPWAKAWYAKGRALYKLGRLDESIFALNTAVEKHPGSEGAIYAHKILGHIYLERGEPGDNELSRLHKQKGGEPITVQE